MRAKLNDVVLVHWSDAPPERAVIISGVASKTEYKVFFYDRKRERVGWVGSDQIKRILGTFKGINIRKGLSKSSKDWLNLGVVVTKKVIDPKTKSGIVCPECETELLINKEKDLLFCDQCNEIYLA